MNVKVLFLGDIFAKSGRLAVNVAMKELRELYTPDIIIANAENIAGGFGVTENLARKLFRYGVDVITLGNHTWNKPDEIGNILDTSEHILRPANYPPANPGHGYTVYTTEKGIKVGVINLMGRVFMPITDCPFRLGREIIERLRQETPIIIIDFHAEATSEKRAFLKYVDGMTSAVVGTHTHIQTADEHITPNGTAYITDCGMTGPHNSVIGIKYEKVIEHYLRGIKVRFEPASENIRVQGVFITINARDGHATNIERVDIPVQELPGGEE